MTENTKDPYADDNRQQKNNNPDRPPISPGQPDRPAAFDPFSTPKLPDGGTTVRDTTEAVFDVAIEQTQSTVTPQKPSVNPDRQQKDVDSDSLIGFLRGFITVDSTFTYDIERNNNGVFDHYVYLNREQKGSIKHCKNGFLVSHQLQTEEKTTETQYFEAFENAIAGLIEAIDWGSLPPGETNPHIWEYTGFNKTHGSFEEYLSGNTNKECGGHELINTCAEYKIVIENYKDKRKRTRRNSTMCIVTIKKTTMNESELLFQDRFNGQKEGFEFVLENLNAGLSKQIALYEGKHGNSDVIPSTIELQQIE
jgi:hypothetical protein